MEFLVLLKRDCETCRMVEPVLAHLRRHLELTLYSQDDPAFPETAGGSRDDSALEESWRRKVEIVPTLIRLEDGVETARTEGWNRVDWERVIGVDNLGPDLPAHRPGCGSRSVEPGMPERLILKYGDIRFGSRAITVDAMDDEVEAAFDRGWTDGLPIVPPTDLRILRMLGGTARDAHEILGAIPPDLAPCTVEKAAINAVMAGCRPEYFPVVLAAIEAALRPEFSMHGLLATLWFSGPVVIVNGPVTRRIGMNWAGNALGQGNRANATIGRALQLVIRNVGGGRPQGIDRSVMGNPGKFTFCFAEDETDPDWVPLNVARGHARGSSTVTLFHGDGVQGVCDQQSRDPTSLARSLAMALWAVSHPKLAQWSNAILVLSPDHYDIFKQGGWDRAKIEAGIWQALKRPGRDLIAGAGGVGVGIDVSRAEDVVDKFHPGGLIIVRAGGAGGLFSAIIGGWTAQRRHTEVKIVSTEIGT